MDCSCEKVMVYDDDDDNVPERSSVSDDDCELDFVMETS